MLGSINLYQLLNVCRSILENNSGVSSILICPPTILYHSKLLRCHNTRSRSMGCCSSLAMVHEKFGWVFGSSVDIQQWESARYRRAHGHACSAIGPNNNYSRYLIFFWHVNWKFLPPFVMLVSDTRKCDRELANLLHDELHWLDVPQWVSYSKLCANGSPMRDCCIHTSDTAHAAVWSAGCRQLFVPLHRRSMFGRRTFSVAGPVAWSSFYQTRSDTFFWQFSLRSENFTFLALAYTVECA